MITSEAEYEDVRVEERDLTEQYNALSQINRSRPYCGPKMLLRINKLRQELRQWEKYKPQTLEDFKAENNL